jgi:hypothetical protein
MYLGRSRLGLAGGKGLGSFSPSESLAGGLSLKGYGLICTSFIEEREIQRGCLQRESRTTPSTFLAPFSSVIPIPPSPAFPAPQ